MIKTKSDSALDFWFDTDILFSEKLPQIEVKDADKLDRILWTFLPRKTQAQWTFVERDNPIMVPCAFVIACPVTLYV